MSVTRHLSSVPDTPRPDPAPPDRRIEAKWLVRVWQAIGGDTMTTLLAEAIVDTEADAADYAHATHRAVAPPDGHVDDDEFIWAMTAPGYKSSPHGIWIPLGETQHAVFTSAGHLTDWVPGPRPRN